LHIKKKLRILLIKCHLKYWEKHNLSVQVTARAEPPLKE